MFACLCRMFKFNFGEECAKSKDDAKKEEAEVPRVEAREHFLSESHLEVLADESKVISAFIYAKGQVINHLEITEDNAEATAEAAAEAGAEAGASSDAAPASDLVPGVYEGGLKIWECSRDLTEYLGERPDEYSDLRRRRVLELGCGAGLPGLHCLSAGACVDFQVALSLLQNTKCLVGCTQVLFSTVYRTTTPRCWSA